VFNQEKFLFYQKQAEDQGRRMTRQEAEDAGVPADDYHKVYGPPPAGTLEKLQAQYGGNPPAQALIDAGFSPREVSQQTGLPEGLSAADLVQAQAGQQNYQTGIAKQGAVGTGGSIGAAREINPYQITNTPEMQSARIADAALNKDIQIGEIERAQGAQIDPATQMQRAELGDAALIAEQNAYRDKQLGLASALEDTIAGRTPSLAELQLRSATDRNNAQAQGLIASQRGVNAGLATRLAGQQAGAANQAAAGEVAQLRLAEAIAARQELAALSAQGRGQDFQVDSTNQNAKNAFAIEQGQLAQQANATNANAMNARALQQAQLQQQSGQFNAQSANARQSEQASLTSQRTLADQLALNQRSQQQAQFQQQANAANAQLQQDTNLRNADLSQTAALANQQAVNQQEIARGQTEAGIQNTRTGAGAQVGAAQASAWGNVQSSQIRADADIFTNTQNNLVGLEAIQSNANVAGGQTSQSANNQNAQNTNNFVNAGMGALGTAGILALSDEKKKQKVKSADPEIRKWLDELSAKNYEYKDKKWGTGKKTGVMAQDLEKSPIGKSMVNDTPDGKVVNFGHGLGAMMASLANINKRLKELEG